ncbi:MAG: hypothetical protein RLY86_831 [Pseudomonadota bacterium]|jgi:hypothetical protein
MRERHVFAGILTALATLLALSSGSTAAALGPDTKAPIIEAYRDVAGVEVEYSSRRALSLELTAEEQSLQRAGAGGNRPTYAIVPGSFENGIIEVDIAANLNGRGGAESRGFAGVAFRLGDDGRFDAVYLRAANGSRNVPPPPPPRDVRAIQYISHPDFHFSESRAVAPGVYEKAAPIAVGTWHRLRLEINGSRLVASVDDQVVLQVDNLRLDRPGNVALWVGDGTSAYFSNLRITPAER